MKTGSAMSVEEAVEVGRPLEEYQWLQAHPCLCGGEWELVEQRLIAKGQNERGSRMTDQLEICCATCGRRGQRYFVVQYDGLLSRAGPP